MYFLSWKMHMQFPLALIWSCLWGSYSYYGFKNNDFWNKGYLGSSLDRVIDNVKQKMEVSSKFRVGGNELNIGSTRSTCYYIQFETGGEHILALIMSKMMSSLLGMRKTSSNWWCSWPRRRKMFVYRKDHFCKTGLHHAGIKSHFDGFAWARSRCGRYM